MNRGYLGDSYDVVKRMWQELLAGWAPLHADTLFVPVDLRQEYTRFTRIPMLPDQPPNPYSILNDPDTGIKSPTGANQKVSREHATIQHIVMQLWDGAQCVITFDQSVHRSRELSPADQRKAKMHQLQEHGLCSFYYVFHAPFLFALRNINASNQLQRTLKQAGIPEERLEMVSIP